MSYISAEVISVFPDVFLLIGLLYLNISDLRGSENEAALIYGINGIPHNFLIDDNGSIIARNLRGETLTKKLEELLGENQIAANEGMK